MRNMTPVLAAAKRKWEDGDGPEAERLWRLILAEDPANVTAAKALGVMLLDSQRFREAHEALAIAARKKPFDIDLRMLMGQCLLGFGQTAVAMQTFESVLRSDPRSAPATVGMARCLLAGHRAQQALALLRPILASHPDDPDVRSVMGHASYALVLGEDAAAHFGAAAAGRPSPGLRADLGWALYMAQRPDEALAEFDHALAADPALATAIAGKARILTDRNDVAGARHLVSAALEQGSLDARLLMAPRAAVQDP